VDGPDAKRVLIASHEWEVEQPGGAQRSAVALAHALTAVGGIDVTLVSAVAHMPDDLPDGRLGRPQGFDERLVVSRTDATLFTWTDPHQADGWANVLREIQPDVVHMHHYFHVGIDLPVLVRRCVPHAGLVLTLHEYLAICLRSGQMVDGARNLCTTSGTRRCADCVGWSTDAVAARADYVRRGLADVDVFITPSAFARGRYRDWFAGADEEPDIRVIPNALTFPELEIRPERAEGALRLAYIGQHTPSKGLGLLLAAVALAERDRPGVLARVDVYGDGSDRFDEAFHTELMAGIASASPLVQARGRYAQDDLPAILDDVDAVVVPSTWWENSPVVIEEALARRVPVICSDIGGMAERVRDGVDGWHFAVGNSSSLAEVIGRVADAASATLPGMRRPTSVATVVQEHLVAYSDSIAKSTRG